MKSLEIHMNAKFHPCLEKIGPVWCDGNKYPPEPRGWSSKPGSAMTNCVTSAMLPNLSVPWFPHLSKGDTNNIYS